MHYGLALRRYHLSKLYVNFAELISEEVKKFLLILVNSEKSCPVARNFGVRLDMPSDPLPSLTTGCRLEAVSVILVPYQIISELSFHIRKML